MGAPAVRTYELAKEWVKAGNSVLVNTAFPHHPTGIVPPEYQGQRFLREEIDGIQVVRTFVYATANKGFLKRTLSYISFMFSAILCSPFLRFDPQVVVATSPQFFVAIAGYIVSRLRKKPFIFEVRDLWPESIVAVGALRNRLVIKILTKIEHFLYQKAALIVGVAESTRRILRERGIPDSKIIIVPNGIDLGRFIQSDGREKIRKKYGLEDKFVVSYIGTHGMAHALHKVLDVAVLLTGEEEIHFLFVGEGAEKENLIQYKEKLWLRNVTFVGQQDYCTIPMFLQASDVSLVPLRNVPLFSAVLPSKMFEIMAAECPLILSVRGEARGLIAKAEAGVWVKPEDVEQMRDAILQLFQDRDLVKRLGCNGRRFVTANYARDRLAAQYAESLQELVGRKT